jgi:PAS domain S-box-containing protein
MNILNVLMLESNSDDALLLQRELRRAGFSPQVTIVQTEADFISQLEAKFDVILADVTLPSYSAEKALDIVLERQIDVPFILVSSTMTEETGVDFVARGAADYLLKDRLHRLGPAIAKAREDREARTERSRTVRALEASEYRFRRMFEVSLDVILFVNAVDGTILEANPAMFLLGYDPKEVIGKNWSILFPPDTPPSAAEVRDAAATGSTVIMTHVFCRTDGSPIPMDLTATPLEQTEDGQRLLVTLRDVTERLRADAERATAQQINHQFEREKLLNEQRQRFINFAAHEFKNPLTAIRSSNSILREYGDRMTEVARRKHHEQIEEQVQRMLDLISDMLSVGRLNEGNASVSFQRIDLAGFTRAMIEEIRTSYPNQPYRYDADLGDYAIAADPKLLQQILNNLLGNAARYSPDKRLVTVTLSRERDTLVLRVADQGIGIRPDDLPTLFEPFKRGSNVGSISGTGLGLSIVKQSVEAHGGTIEVESAVGHGSTFTVRFPAANRHTPKLMS